VERIGQAEEEEDDDDGKIYNPLKLPLGWDGKPIPFWLYKLHGLGVEFKCEVSRVAVRRFLPSHSHPTSLCCFDVSRHVARETHS
jgi:hypothetical protein